MADKFNPNPKNQIKRAPQRGHYDWETISAILKKSFLCHIGLIQGSNSNNPDYFPVVIPTLYGVSNEDIYLHGSSASRLMNQLDSQLCFSVTILNGLVLARSGFHHSANYESVVLFGKGKKVDGPEKLAALKIISDQCLSGRWEEVRPPNQKEMKATTVLKFEIETGSAKIRSGDPVDDEEDYQLNVWAGVLPLKQGVEMFNHPIPDQRLKKETPLSPSLKNLQQSL